MSLILDALNRSEQERRDAQSAPNLHAFHAVSDGDDHDRRRYVPWILVALLSIALLVVAMRWFVYGVEQGAVSVSPPVSPSSIKDNAVSPAVADQSLDAGDKLALPPPTSGLSLEEREIPQETPPKEDIRALYDSPPASVNQGNSPLQSTRQIGRAHV